MSTILLVEDHEMTRKTLERRLSRAGYSVLEAGTGAMGLDILSNKNVDLVLIDFMMKNMNGMQTYEKIREMNPQVPCAMITAYANGALIKQFISRGGADFMVKPIGEDFERRIDAILHQEGDTHPQPS